MKGLIAALLASASPAFAQDMHCGDRSTLILYLMQEFQEVPTVEMIDKNGAKVEITTSEIGTWTLILHTPDGRVCPMVHGSGFETLGELG